MSGRASGASCCCLLLLPLLVERWVGWHTRTKEKGAIEHDVQQDSMRDDAPHHGIKFFFDSRVIALRLQGKKMTTKADDYGTGHRWLAMIEFVSERRR